MKTIRVTDRDGNRYTVVASQIVFIRPSIDGVPGSHIHFTSPTSSDFAITEDFEELSRELARH